MLQTVGCHFVLLMQGTAEILKSDILGNLRGFGSAWLLMWKSI
jgi:hypothetical protein